MAKQIDWTSAMDGGIAVAGAGLLDEFVVKNVATIGDLVTKLPDDIMGISVKMVLLGAVSLVAYKYFVK